MIEANTNVAKATTQDKVLQVCQNGTVEDLESVLKATSADMLPSAEDMMKKACYGSNATVVKYFLEKYPNVCPSTGPQGHLHMEAFDGGLEVYSIFLDRFPELKRNSFGYYGGPVYRASSQGDVAKLRWLLERGFNPDLSHFMNKPTLTVAQEAEDDDEPWKPEIISLLKEFGAHLTGEECYPDDVGF